MSAPKRILVVEDETMIAFHMESTLSDLGHHVKTATSASEAEAILSEDDIDVAVIDYHLTDGTSLQLAERLHALGVPFVVCSGSVGLSELGEVFQHTTFLPKPFTTDGLIEAVAAMAREDA